jgi:hypothetical protein
MYWRTMAVPRGLQATVIAVAVCLFPTVVRALSLGELKVYSALDEPLYAEILLAPTGTKDIKTLQVRLVARPDFDVDADATAPISGEVRVTVTQRQDGQHLLKLYSERPVREPYLRFLLQLDWAGGRLTREFVALIDPPELRSAEVARPDEAMTEAALEETAERPSADAQPASRPEAPAPTGPAGASARASAAAAEATTRSVSASKPADAGRAASTRDTKSTAQGANTRPARKSEPKDVVVSETPKATQGKAEQQRERLASEIKAWAKTQEQTRPTAKTTGSDIAAPPEEQAAKSETTEARVQPETSAKPEKRETPNTKTGLPKPSAAPPVAVDTPLLQWTRENVTRLLIIALALLAVLAGTIGAAWYVWRRWHQRTSPRVNYGERRNGEGRRRQFLPVAIERRRGPRRDSDRVVSDYHVVHADDDYDDDVGHLETHTEEPTERALQKAIATHPQQHSLKVKLLGLYYQSNNKQAFESLLNRLYADLVEMPGPEHQVASAFDELVQDSLAEQREDNKDIPPDDATPPSVITGIGGSKTEYSYPTDDLRDAVTVVPDSKPIAPEDGIPVLNFGEESSQTSDREDARTKRPNVDNGLEWENKKDLAAEDSKVSPSKEKSQEKAKHSAKDSNDAGLEELSIGDLIDIGSADGHALLDDIEFEGVDTPEKSMSNKRGAGSKDEKEGDNENLGAQEKSSEPKVEQRQQWRDPAIKIDLAKAYIDMGDPERARHILDEVLASWHRGDGTEG